MNTPAALAAGMSTVISRPARCVISPVSGAHRPNSSTLAPPSIMPAVCSRHRIRDRQVPRLARRHWHPADIPVWEKSDREDGTVSRSDFRFDRERNVYICPADKLLKTTGNVGSDHKVRYRALKRECRACPLKPQCCPTPPRARSHATSTRTPAIMHVPS
jgi:hypothetical protein